MSDLLVRDVSDETKQWLVAQAVKHGRSQSAEARALLDDAAALAKAQEINPFIKFAEACQEIGGVELDIPSATPVRDPDVWWLKEDAITTEGTQKGHVCAGEDNE